MRVALSFLSSLIVHLVVALSFLVMKPGSVPLPVAITVDLPEPALPPEDAPEQLASTPNKELKAPEPPPTIRAATEPSPTSKTHAPERPAKPLAVKQAQKKLMEHLLYPPDAVRQGLEGEAVLLLTLDSQGIVTAITLARSSGHSLLDAAAISAARQVGRLRSTSGQMLLPVEFALD